jgi:hypothetical protein
MLLGKFEDLHGNSGSPIRQHLQDSIDPQTHRNISTFSLKDWYGAANHSSDQTVRTTQLNTNSFIA